MTSETNQAEVEPATHEREAAALWQAYGRQANDRVPVTFAADEQLWLHVSGHSFGAFYADPRVHLEAQLAGRQWLCEHVRADAPAGLPDHWDVGVQLWMEENEFFGCHTTYQDDDYAWAAPLECGDDELLGRLADIDAEERVRQSRAYAMYQALRQLTASLTHLDRPVRVAPPGGSTHGIFTKAAEIRGPERLCLDLYEAPAFAERFLRLVTDKTVERIRAWSRVLDGADPELPRPGGFHFCDDSLQLLSPQLYERFVLPCHERLFAAMTTGPRRLHLCGYAAQHFDALRHRLGVVTIDGPGPFVDHGRYLDAFGPEFSFHAQTDHQVLARGSRDQIEAMMRRLLSPAARRPGRFQIMGFVQRDTPLAHVAHCYACARALGRMETKGP